MNSIEESMDLQGNGRQYVLSFEEIDGTLLARVGGKGANLGVLTRAGLPVPEGFCVTTEAYTHIAGTDKLQPFLEELVEEQEQSRIFEIAGKIRERIEQTEMPEELKNAVRAAYLALGNSEPVAVRSSATAEDLPFASFAGQQDTYLNIVGEDAVVDAVQRCWASLWTERAVSYRKTNGIDPRSVSLSVVVQKMIDVEVAGVLFTANPLTGKRRQAVIDASPGLGEAVVSGAVNPDHFVVQSGSGEIVERRIGDKRVVIQSVAGGGTKRIERDSQGEQACVTDEQVRELARLGTRVEGVYQEPQDIEWAIDSQGKLWLTQARPITTLYPLPESAPTTDDVLRVYFSFNVAQGVYQPFTMLGLDTFRLFIGGVVRTLGFPLEGKDTAPSFFQVAGMRIFLDSTNAIRNPLGRRLFGFILPFAEARSAEIIKALESDPRLKVSLAGYWGFIRRAAGVVTKLKVPVYLLQAVLRPEATRQRVLGVRQQLQQQLTVPANASALQRLDVIERFGGSLMFRVMGTLIPVLAGGFISFGLAGKLLGRLATADEKQTVLRSLPYNPTTEMDLELWHIAKKIATEKDVRAYMLGSTLTQLNESYQQQLLPSVVQQSLEAFLQEYGHRSVAEIDIGLARWSDNPTHILGVLVNYLRLEDENVAPDVQFERGARQADAMVAELSKRARKRGWLRGKLVKFCLRRTRMLLGMREMPKFYLVWSMARMREILRPVGAELVDTGKIEQSEDIYFLTYPEVRRAVCGENMDGIVQERRAIYEHEMRRRHVPRILLSDGSEPTASVVEGEEKDVLRGSPASAGNITAKARVVLNPIGAHLEPGEILVAPSTDPGWTPLFLTAGGLVMEMGGAMSHGAVVAREYGIPAVVGVAGAIERIENGQMITVDGSSGRIVLGE